MQAQPAAAGQPAFMRAYRIRGARRFLWEAVRFVWAVTCMRGTPPPVGAEGILKEEGKNPLLAAKKVGGAAGGALYWILITR